MLHQNALLVARCHKLDEQLAVITKKKRVNRSGSSKFALWCMVTQQPRQPLRPPWLLNGQRRLVVVVIKKETGSVVEYVNTSYAPTTTFSKRSETQK
jgi:hypothetical protein